MRLRGTVQRTGTVGKGVTAGQGSKAAVVAVLVRQFHEDVAALHFHHLFAGGRHDRGVGGLGAAHALHFHHLLTGSGHDHNALAEGCERIKNGVESHHGHITGS